MPGRLDREDNPVRVIDVFADALDLAERRRSSMLLCSA
jgi:hypothetical protein